MSTAPPPYSSEPSQAEPPVIVLPVVYFKLVRYDKPYFEFCPVCMKTVKTSIRHVPGSVWYALLIIGAAFLLIPFLLCLLWSRTKDVRHYCPNCNAFLAHTKRFGGGEKATEFKLPKVDFNTAFTIGSNSKIENKIYKL
ncbi:unnamed protein product [Caenorhabditis nigoni]